MEAIRECHMLDKAQQIKERRGKLTVSLIVLGASHFSGQTVDGTYQQFKREHEMMLRSERIKEESVRQYQEEHRIWSRSLAKLLMNKDKKLGDGVSDSERGSNDA